MRKYRILLLLFIYLFMGLVLVAILQVHVSSNIDETLVPVQTSTRIRPTEVVCKIFDEHFSSWDLALMS